MSILYMNIVKERKKKVKKKEIKKQNLLLLVIQSYPRLGSGRLKQLNLQVY